MPKALFISTVAAFILTIVLVFIFFARGRADSPTSATAPEKLKKVSLPGQLSPLYEIRDANASASDLYLQAMEYYMRHRSQFSSKGKDEHSAKVADMLIEAMHAGLVTPGFVDDKLPMKPGRAGVNDWSDAFGGIGLAAVLHARHEGDRNNTARATEVAKAAFAYGHRLYEANYRLPVRDVGLQTMSQASLLIQSYAPQGDPVIERARKWTQAIDQVRGQWKPKLAILQSTTPHVGDTLNMAANDEDPSFRVEATSVLGLIKWNPRGRGNARAVKSAIEEALDSDDPMIRQAAEAADAMTREDIHYGG